jgi:hypothetical protein
MNRTLKAFSFITLLLAALILTGCPAAIGPVNDTGAKLAAKLPGFWFLTNQVITVTNKTTTNTYTAVSTNRFYLNFLADGTCQQISVTNSVTNTNNMTYYVDNSSNLYVTMNLPSTNFAINFGFYIVYNILSANVSLNRPIAYLDATNLRLVGIEKASESLSGTISVYMDSGMTNLLTSESVNSNIQSNLNESPSDYDLYIIQ